MKSKDHPLHNLLPKPVVSENQRNLRKISEQFYLFTRNTCLQQPLAFISKHCVNTMFQHEVFRVISTLNAGSLCLRLVNHGNKIFFKIFWTKGHQIVEILALLTTKLSRSKMYKVGMLFSIQWTFKFQHETLRESL